MTNTTLLEYKVLKFNKLFNIVSDYYNSKRKRGLLKEGVYFDVISDIMLHPNSIILYANQMLEEQEKVERAIDNAECPHCGSVLEIESEEVGDRLQVFGFACTKCNWRSE